MRYSGHRREDQEFVVVISHNNKRTKISTEVYLNSMLIPNTIRNGDGRFEVAVAADSDTYGDLLLHVYEGNALQLVIPLYIPKCHFFVEREPVLEDDISFTDEAIAQEAGRIIWGGFNYQEIK